MKKILLAVAAVLVGLFALSPMSSVEANPISSQSLHGTLSGKIIDENGDALTSAMVSVVIQGSTETVITGRTDANGQYKLSLPQLQGAYTFKALHIGYSPVTIGMVKQSTGWNIPSAVAMKAIASEPSPF